MEEGLRRLQSARAPHLVSDAALDRAYIVFCMAAESIMASRQVVDYDAAKTHRGWPVATKEVPLAAPSPAGWRCKPPGLTTWCALRTRLDNYIGVIRKKCAGLYAEHLQALRAQLERVKTASRILPAGPGEADVIRHIQAICEGTLPLRDLEMVAKEIRTTIRRRECHLAAEGRRGYQQWNRESLNSGGGLCTACPLAGAVRWRRSRWRRTLRGGLLCIPWIL